MKLWILIWRMQPLHLWHQRVIEKSLGENDLTFIILWSSWIQGDDRNIFNDEQRKKFLQTFLKKKTRNKTIFLEDHPSESQWLQNLDELITKTWEEYLNTSLKRLLWWTKFNKDDIEIWEQKFKDNVDQITFYWWDLKNDYAIQVITSHKQFLNYNNIMFIEVNREELSILHNWEDIYISSTRIRSELKNKNWELLEKMVDRKILSEIKKI